MDSINPSNSSVFSYQENTNQTPRKPTSNEPPSAPKKQPVVSRLPQNRPNCARELFKSFERSLRFN